MINLALKRKISVADRGGKSSKSVLVPVFSLRGSSHQCMNHGHIPPASPPWGPCRPLEGPGSAWSVLGTKL